jgi:hypothetical protein
MGNVSLRFRCYCVQGQFSARPLLYGKEAELAAPLCGPTTRKSAAYYHARRRIYTWSTFIHNPLLPNTTTQLILPDKGCPHALCGQDGPI